MTQMALRRALSPAVGADAAVIAVVGAVLGLQHVGQTRFDTKLDLLVDPWGFLGRGLVAWDPSAGFGQLQNQAYGYLFPMGPFFGVLHSVGIPAWVTQWLWAWLLLGLAYLGVRRVASRLGLPWWAATAGGLAYALAPRMVTVIGPLSAEVLAAALMPWMVIPLLRPSASVRRTAFLSALPVLFMGAANATLTLSVLVVPAVWIMLRSRNRWRLMAWWAAFVAAFCSWWMVPLLVQAAYATPFLTFIESARDTTVGLTAGEVIRGDVHWVAGIIDYGAPWWPAGYALSAWTVPAMLTFLLAGIGLAGLASREMPERLTNGVLLLLGVLILAAGATMAPLHGVWWELLDGALAPFRNVHKFDPVLRFPLALGVAAACAAVIGGRERLRRAQGARTWAVVGIGIVILGVASPLAWPGVAAGRTWTQMPTWWEEATAWLGTQEGDGRVLVAPGSGFGQYLWGRTIDEPLQPLSPVPWVVDNDLPLGSVGSARVLDSISTALSQGRRSDGLADLLARSGIRYVLVRNDIDTGRTLAPSRSVVSATLQHSPGLRLRAAFGDVTLEGTELTATDFGRDGDRPALEIYEVSGAVPAIEAVATAESAVMTGGPEGLLPALGAGVIARDTPVVFADDSPPASVRGALVVTDSLLRRDRALARGNEAFSGVLTATEQSRVKRRANDLIPFTDPSFTVADYRGVSDLRASSSQSYGNSLGPLLPERQPFAALDASADTWWQSASVGGPVGEWWEATLPQARDLRGLALTVMQSPLVGSAVTSVEITTDRGSVVEQVDAEGAVGPLDDPILEGARSLRITAASAQGSAGNFGLRDVRMPGVQASLPLLTPMPPATDTAREAIQLSARQPRRPACVQVDDEARCDPTSARAEGDSGVLDRLVTLRQPLDGTVEMRGVVRPGAMAALLFDPLGTAVQARGSSWLGREPLVRPGAAVDGDLATAWVADLGDPQPSLSITWDLPRVIDGMRIRARDSGQAFAQPLSVRVTLAGRRIDAEVGQDGYVSLPNVLATSMNIEVTRWSPLSSIDSVSGQRLPLPVHIAEVDVPAIADLVYTPDPAARSGSICGLGPSLAVDDTVLQTRVDATLAQILRGDPVRVIPCGPKSLSLAPGTHRITSTASELIDPLSITVAPRDAPGDDTGVLTRTVEVDRWSATERLARIGAGPESILRVAESANAGWVAELDGMDLPATRVDGWQQAWIVPAGKGGTLSLSYRPQAQQSAGLLGGLALIIVALVVGLLPVRGRGPHPRAAVPWRVLHPYDAGAVPAPGAIAGGGVLVAWGVLVAGFVGMGCAGLGILAGRRKWAPGLVMAALAAAAVSWSFGGPADVLALLGAAIAAYAAITSRDA